MHSFKKYILLLIVTITISSTISHLSAQATPHKPINKQATMSIVGTHSVLIKHDQATINANVTTHAPRAKKAVRQNADIIDNIRNALKNAHFDANLLFSKGYNLKAQYDYIKSKKVFRHYEAIHNLSFTTKNIENIGKITDIIAEAGANQILNIQFSSTNTDKAYDMALKNAVLNAYNKAKLAISGIDTMRIGKALNIHINPTRHRPHPIAYNDAPVMMRTAEKSSAPTMFKTKGDTITVNVQTTWELLEK